MDKALRIAGRLMALMVSSTLLTLIALNIRTAWPDIANHVRILQGVASVYLLMLWFPSTRWKE